MLKILVASTLIVLVMVGVRNGHALEKSGLLGSCSAVATPAGQTGYWQSCRAGRLDGRPDLSLRPCTAKQTSGKLEYWRCPTPLDSDRS